jgi:hypothetical protein
MTEQESNTSKVVVAIILLLGGYWLYRKFFVTQPATVVTTPTKTSGTATTSNVNSIANVPAASTPAITSNVSPIANTPAASTTDTSIASSVTTKSNDSSLTVAPSIISSQVSSPQGPDISQQTGKENAVYDTQSSQSSTEPVTFPSEPPVETFPSVAPAPITFPTTDVAAQNNVSYSERQMNINNIVCTTDSNGIIQNTYSSFNQTLLSDYINQFDVTSDELSTARDYCLSSGMTPIVSSPASQPVVMPAPILPSSDVTNIQYDSMGQQIQSFI